MRVVVADTSPIIYLVLIESIDLLRRLYRRVVIPEEVLRELSAPGRRPRWLPGKVMKSRGAVDISG